MWAATDDGPHCGIMPTDRTSDDGVLPLGYILLMRTMSPGRLEVAMKTLAKRTAV